MDLQVTGTIKEILPEQSGEGRNGPWRKQEFILETGGNYPKQICIVQWGDNIDKFGLAEGEQLTAHIDLQSREFNGRWYTDVKAWKIQRDAGGQGMPQGMEAGMAPPMPTGEPFNDPLPSGDDDGLPF